MIVGILQMAIILASYVVSLRWIHRMNWNARALGAARLDFTPGWSAGWYFIPIMNLWKPFQAMKQIWQASAQPKDWEMQPTPALLGWWWLLWVVSSLFSNASLRLGMRAEELDELITASRVTMMSALVDIPLCLVFLVVIHRISAMQARHAAAPAPPEAVVVPAAGG